VQWRSYVLWPIFGWYVAGAAISFAGMWTIAFVPDKAMVYLTLGLMPFVVESLPAAQWTRAIIFAISAVYLARAGWLFWNR
jgi:hypothetical protein